MTKAWETAYQARTDLTAYGDNALGLFALGLRFNIEDLATVAADAITDGSDDKKCDIVYIDENEGYAVVTQCYLATRQKQSAPANKASDLNTAISWLLQASSKELPERIRSAAMQLRQGIDNGEIKKLYIWYVHNLPESTQVKSELKTVEETAVAALKRHFSERNVATSVSEVGRATFETWYSETLSPILVNDEFLIDIPHGYEVAETDWNAFVTSVPAVFLHRTYKKHKTKIFSANVRDYLGSRSSDSNINNGIKKTAEGEPQNFWVYNNGLTILVNDFELINVGRKQQLKISGMSIVNGAQTTGALGSLSKVPSSKLQIPARFVKTSDSDLVHSIIQFNNSQNKVTASDFRSTDSVQKRLKDQMSRIPNAEYEGGRRGGSGDAIARRPNLLPSYTVGQSLAAFHGDPVTAYNQKTNIWINDRLYSRYFNEETSATHIVFSFSLLRAVEQRKLTLTQKNRSNSALTKTEDKQLAFFRKRGSIYLLVSALAACIETFLGKRVSNLYRLSFGDRVSPKDAQKIWSEIVELTAPLAIHLEEALNDGLKSLERSEAAIVKFQSLVETTASANASQFKNFKAKVQQK
ncbi:AIPR family protein [Hydrogenophaga sp. UC242_50]|uniref:AIPR family protein n=1 Tax=unclassified Hydrogenophaga TaxID=2610897 RepID=UPI0036D2C067